MEICHQLLVPFGTRTIRVAHAEGIVVAFGHSLAMYEHEALWLLLRNGLDVVEILGPEAIDDAFGREVG